MLKYRLGLLLNKLGYKIVENSKYPLCTFNPIELGYELIDKLDVKLGSNGWIIQIGAFDGVVADPLQKVILKTSSKVLLVEPQPEPFNALLTRYNGFLNIVLENLAISKNDGFATLYIPDTNTSLASPMASLLSLHYKRFGIQSVNVRGIEVATVSVKTLLKKNNIESVDILQIDTEGFDYEIIKQFFDMKQYPLIINCETIHLNSSDRLAIRKDFEKYGYLYMDTEYDTFAIRWKEYLSRSSL